MNVNCIVTMGLVPEIKYLVSCILYLVSMLIPFIDVSSVTFTLSKSQKKRVVSSAFLSYQYIDRKCTLCNDNDIQDEYHIVLKCAYYNEVRRKYIKPYYHRHPSMYKFQELMNKSNKRDAFRLMIFIKIVMKDYDSTM